MNIEEDNVVATTPAELEQQQETSAVTNKVEDREEVEDDTESGENGSSSSSRIKPLIPRSLFGSSAALLKEQSQASLVEEVNEEAESSVLSEKKTSDAAEKIAEFLMPSADQNGNHNTVREETVAEIKMEPETELDKAIVVESEKLEETSCNDHSRCSDIAFLVTEAKDVEPTLQELKESEQLASESETLTVSRSLRARRSTATEGSAENVKKTPAKSPARKGRQLEVIDEPVESRSSTLLALKDKVASKEEDQKEKRVNTEPEVSVTSRGSRSRRSNPAVSTTKVSAVVETSVDEPETPKTGRTLRARRSTAVESTPVKEPRSAKKTATLAVKNRSRRGVAQVEALNKSTDEEKSASKADEHENEDEVKTPATTSRSRRAATSAKKTESAKSPATSKAQESEEFKTPTVTRSRRSRQSAALNSTKEIVPPAEEFERLDEKAKTPGTSRSSRRKSSDVALVKKAAESTSGTPKSSARGKKPATPSSKNRRGRQSDMVINLDSDDPFNFDSQAYNHPEPLTNFNVKVQKGSFGEMKFTRSPLSTNIENRYAKTEKAVAKNAFPMTSNLLSPTIRPASITALTTTPETRKELETSKSSQKRANKSLTISSKDIFEHPGVETKSRRKRQETPVSSVKPKMEIEQPQLSPEDQLAVDLTKEPHPGGTRVFALWGNDFYPAVVLDRDGLGRYRVIYTQDKLHRDVPLTGIITLAMLTEGKEVAITVEKNGKELMQPVKIVEAPSRTNVTEWADGFFQVQDVDNEEHGPRKICWTNLFIAKEQQKDIVGELKNQAAIVDEGNAVPRSTRRSRLAATNVIAAEQQLKRSRTQSGSAKKFIPADEESHPIEDTVALTPRRSVQKRGRRSDAVSEQKSMSPPAKRQHKDVSSGNEVEQMEVDQKELEAGFRLIFDSCYVMLTSSARRSNTVHFNKREFKELVERLGGTVAEDISELHELAEDGKAFLVADTYYRTHKYLYALAASIPCLHFNWLTACEEQKKLVDYKPYLLKAGVSVINGQEYEWQPLKGQLFKGKTMFVYSAVVDFAQHTLQFDQIWRPLLEMLGADVLTCNKPDVNDVIAFCNTSRFDYMLTDRSCQAEVAKKVSEKGTPVVSSNWIIHAIITNEMVPVTDHESFLPQE